MRKIIFILFLFLVILPLEVKALSVSKSNLTIEKGENDTVDLYAEVDSEITELSFSLVYTSYDAPAYFNIESGLREEINGIKHRIVFSVPVTGKIKLGTVKINTVKNPKVNAGAVNIHTAKAVTVEDEVINLNSQIINVVINKDSTVNTDVKEPIENKNLLSKIESQIVSINLKDNVYEYVVNVSEDVLELDLKPVAKEESYEIDISSQKIDELEDGKIIITVKNGEYKEEYKVSVKIIEERDEVQIDDSEFKSTFSYKSKWVVLIIVLSIMLVSGLFLNKKQ